MTEDKTPEKPPIAACDWYDMVRAFHKAVHHPAPDYITDLHLDRRKYRAVWMAEEIVEYVGADNLVDQVDSVIDLIYFALGTLVEMGVDPRGLFDLVQDSNMSKRYPDGKPRYREDGKLLKPASWEPPQRAMSEVLRARILEEDERLEKARAARVEERQKQANEDGEIPF